MNANGKTVITFELEKALRRKAEELAKRADRSLGYICRVALRAYVSKRLTPRRPA
jgi:predicted transcriptional regulator